MRYLILLCLIISFNTFAQTSIWRVSKGDSELYIGGTIHVLSKTDFPLPIEYEQAYNKSKMIVFETDLVAMALPETQQALVRRIMYQNGRTLKDDLKASTFQVLVDYAASAGLKIETLNQFKPSMVMLTLVFTELQSLGMGGTGVDMYFNQKAIDDDKKLGVMESLETHLSIIENIGKGYEDEMILSTIEDMKELPLIMNDMKNAWRTGNSKKLAEISLFPMIKDFPDLHRLILVDRNNAWVPRIEALLATPEVEFVLVGALHLISKDGVIAKLHALGYKVELYKN